MNPSRYIEKILSNFGMADCKPHLTPCEMEVDLIDRKPHREMFDSLIYIMVSTRPAVGYTETRLPQNLAKPNYFHLTKAKLVLRYLKDSINQSLIFKESQKPLELERLCDAD